MSVELKPFNIGPIEIATPVILAPLAGYSDLPFRRLCRKLGAPYCATEMLLDQSLLVSGKLRKRLLASDSTDHPVAGQLIGSDPKAMAQAAKMVEEHGFDVVDLNFACPARKAVRRGRGGALMDDPERACRMVSAVIDAVDVPVTVKLRKGFDETNSDDFWRIATHAFDSGASAICVHGRTVEGKYLGQADWQFITEVKRTFSDKTVVGSGDVRMPADALAMLETTGVDAALAARGAIRNPWFFRNVLDLAHGREIYLPSPAEQRDALTRQFIETCEIYGEKRGSLNMRKFGIKYSSLMPNAKRIRIAFCQVTNTADWMKVLDTYYGGA